MSEQIRRTFSKRLSRTIILLAIPLFILSLGSFYQYARVLLHKEALQRSRTILSTTERLVENYLSAIETAAKSNEWLLEENFTPDSLPALSRRIVKLNGSVLSCSVAAEPDAFPEQGSNFSVYSVREGDSIITALEPEFEYYQKNWYKEPIQLGAPCWINPFSDFTEGVINYSRCRRLLLHTATASRQPHRRRCLCRLLFPDTPQDRSGHPSPLPQLLLHAAGARRRLSHSS
jgi:hypothetical protein